MNEELGIKNFESLKKFQKYFAHNNFDFVLNRFDRFI